jgi:RNA-binding protein
LTSQDGWKTGKSVLHVGSQCKSNLPLRGIPIHSEGFLDMQPLTSSQAKYLRGLAHGLNPVVFVGHKGVTPAVLDSVREALGVHELIKLKFIDFKDRHLKTGMAAEIEAQTDSHLAGLIGHTAIFYRRHPDAEKRRITLPGTPRPSAASTR